MVEPLKSRTMTLDQLRKRTKRVLNQCKKQFLKTPYEPGLADQEFIEEFIDPLLTDIWQDTEMEKILDAAQKRPRRP